MLDKGSGRIAGIQREKVAMCAIVQSSKSDDEQMAQLNKTITEINQALALKNKEIENSK